MKKLLKIIGILALLLLVVLLLCPLWLGPIAGLVANSVVPGITGTDFNVEKIRINPYTGSLRVEKLRLANPKGYDAEDAVALDLLSVKIAPRHPPRHTPWDWRDATSRRATNPYRD